MLVFYGHHLVNVYLFRDDPSIAHLAVTTIVLAWSAEVIALHLCLLRRWLPEWLKYAATAADIVLVTALLVVSGDPRTWLAALYLLVIAAAPLRLSLPLIYGATLGILGYGFFLAYARYWFDLSDAQRLSRPNQVIPQPGRGGNPGRADGAAGPAVGEGISRDY